MSGKRVPIQLAAGIFRGGSSIQVVTTGLLPWAEKGAPRRHLIGTRYVIEANKGLRPGDALFSISPSVEDGNVFNWYDNPQRLPLGTIESSRVKVEWHASTEKYAVQSVLRILRGAFAYLGWSEGQSYSFPAEVHPETGFIQVRYPTMEQRPFRLLGGR